MKAYKTEIHPTEEQRRHIEQTFSACRYVFNQYIAANQKAYEARENSFPGIPSPSTSTMGFVLSIRSVRGCGKLVRRLSSPQS